REPVLSGPVAEEAPSQAADRAAAVRRGARARARARRALAHRDRLAGLRPSLRRDRAGRSALRGGRPGVAPRRPARVPAADEVREARPAARARGRGLVLPQGRRRLRARGGLLARTADAAT